MRTVTMDRARRDPTHPFHRHGSGQGQGCIHSVRLSCGWPKAAFGGTQSASVGTVYTKDSEGPALLASLRQCQAELAGSERAGRGLGRDQSSRRSRTASVASVARHLDERLTRNERKSSGIRGWARRRLNRNVATVEEIADARELRRSRLLDGIWYLSTYPEVASTGGSARRSTIFASVPPRGRTRGLSSAPNTTRLAIRSLREAG